VASLLFVWALLSPSSLVPFLTSVDRDTSHSVRLQACRSTRLFSLSSLFGRRVLAKSRMVIVQGHVALHAYQICCHLVLSYSLPARRRLVVRQYLAYLDLSELGSIDRCVLRIYHQTSIQPLGKHPVHYYRFLTALPSLYQPPSTIRGLHILSPSPTHLPFHPL
jgi:hypothetical protein